MMYGGYQPKATELYKVPAVAADAANPTAWVQPDTGQPLAFHSTRQGAGQSQPVELVPLYKVIREGYAVYWKVNSKSI
jgi:hypothetical protein